VSAGNPHEPDYLVVGQDLGLREWLYAFFGHAVYAPEVALVRYGYAQIIYCTVVAVSKRRFIF
jgi:hypothetical protein